MRNQPRVLLAAEGLLPKASGIGRVARLTARVLAEEQRRGRLQARAISLSDSTAASDLGLAIKPCGNSRMRFVVECARAAADCDFYLHDAVSVARAHPRWFYPHRRSLVWMHGVEVWESARSKHLRVLRHADCLVSNTAYTRDRAQRVHGGFEHVHTCWLATESDEASHRVPLAGAEQTVLLLGRIDPHGGRKGHRELIAAWPRVVAELPRARLLLAGGGPAAEMVKGWVSSSPVRDNIDFIGFVREDQVEALWNRASVLAMPSRGEGFGLAYVEAMRHGLPVLGSIYDAAVEVNEHGVTGFNTDLEKPDALATALLTLLSQPELMRRMGEAGRERWYRHFRYSCFRERFTPILEEYLGLA